MNTNLTNPEMNIEDYEDQAIKKSKLAKGIGIAVGGAVGGAAIAAGTTYAATQENPEDILNEAMSAEEMLSGAEVGEDIEPTSERAPQSTTQYVYVEKPEPEPEPEPEITWDETTNYYVGDEKVMTVQEGTVEGHDFMLVDADGDGGADVFALDVNNNHVYEVDEIMKLGPNEQIQMGHETAHTVDKHYDVMDPWDDTEESHEEQIAQNHPNQHRIHNDFEDEKTGEYYDGDFAENNPDYNPDADVDYGNGQYLAENYGYDNEESYSASLHEDEFEENVAPQDDLANADMEEDSYDTMLDNEEFLG